MTEFGVALPVFDSFGIGALDVVSAARRAERLGFDSVWAGDHLFFHPPNLECLIALAAAAGATERIHVGSAVLLPALRDPVPLIKELLTLSLVSGGRFELGVGVGGEYAPEWRAVGVDARERGARTDEFLELFDAAVQGSPLDHVGHHLRADSPAFRPVPPPQERPRLWVGGRSKAAMRRAVRWGAGWLTVWGSPRRLLEARHELDRLAAEQDVTAPSVGLMVFLNVDRRERALRECEEFVRRHYQLPFERMAKWFVAGDVDHVAETLISHLDAGVRNLVLYPAARAFENQYEPLAEVVTRIRGHAATKERTTL